MASTSLNTQQVQTTYSEMTKKKEIAPFLNLVENDAFEVVSEYENLVMLHYRDDADKNLLGNLRGVVVDKNYGNVVSYSLPYTPTFTTNHLTSENGYIRLGDQTVETEKLKFKIGFEGTLITVFKYGGKVFRCTRKRLDFSRSRWGNSKTFGDIYTELSGPSDEELFDTEKEYSPFCHYFILVHPDVMICSKDNTYRLIYLGSKTMYSKEKCKYPLDKVDFQLRAPTRFYKPENITLEQANEHLMFGFYQRFEGYEFLDPRLLPGEFLILENTENGEMYRIQSEAYSWRTEMRNNNPNLFHRFFEFLDYSYLSNKPEDESKYKKMFPILTFYELDLLKNLENPIVVWPQKTDEEHEFPSTKDLKLYNIWQTFLISVPLSRQKEVIGFYERFMEKRNEVVAWLNEKSKNIENIGLTDYSKRFQDILLKTREFAYNTYRKDQSNSIETLIHNNIKSFISNERGRSLYGLIREMDKEKENKE